ncbi:MAG: aminopeptidase [Bdellovibrionaceae bacterium]|nr:aminopeptidase [Pseudobdellovibrionaceae bacterium]
MGYLAKSAYNQLSLLNQRVPIEEALNDPTLEPSEKQKLLLSQDVRTFAETKLKLNVKKNYSTYVKLDRPYVSYVVSASPKWKLETHLWGFPIVGKMPYKGYFSEKDAKEEADSLKADNFDVYVRGVSAYSTLGWFKDPLLSSMLRYKDHDLVNTIIHESVHATLFIKNEADFNERLATFLGNKGMELYYHAKEGENSETLKLVRNENIDEKKFSEFITAEIKAMENWYSEQKEQKEELRQSRLQEIKTHFTETVKPKMVTESYNKFDTIDLNNARLIVYKTYLQDMSDFENLYTLAGNDFEKFMIIVKRLEKHDKPSEGLKELVVELKKGAAQ